MKKKDKARVTFDNGFNCAQSVLKPFVKELGASEFEVMRLSAGFGAGMGRMQLTCGAVTGAYMVLGLKFGKQIPDDESKEKVVSLMQEFNAKFAKKNGSDSCRDLLQVDLKTEAGQGVFEKQELHKKVCTKCVESSVTLLEKIFEENDI
jgi:C_GCAxxG_C_C family probable redox protein